METRYYHLSNTGSQPGVGTSFDRGDSMAPSDDTGCSTGPHLHFALYVGGSARDPYAGLGEWVAGSPLPMGYRDQNGTVHGPYAIDYPSFHTLWENLEGEPGSPLNDDGSTMVGQGNSEILYQNSQPFEHGTMTFETGIGVQYNPYTETYLPDIRADKNANGWKSIIVIRNNGNSQAKVNVTFYARDGFFTGSGQVLESRTHTALPARGVWVVDTRSVLLDYLNETYGLYPDVFEGSAIVYASQDVSVVVKTTGPQEVTGYSGFQPGSAFGFSAPGAKLYGPYVFKHYYNWHSTLSIQNVGSSQTTVTVRYRHNNGSLADSTVETIQPGASWVFNPDDAPGIPANWLGSAVVSSSDQPLAAVVTSQSEVSPYRRMVYNAVSRGGNVSLPLLFKGYYNFNTAFQVQNTSSSGTTVEVHYYEQDGDEIVAAAESMWLNGRGSYTFNQATNPYLPSGASGSFSARVTAGQGLAAVANETNTTQTSALNYTGFDGGSQTLILPRIARNDGGWSTALQIQNVGSGSANVTVNYYNSSGEWQCSDPHAGDPPITVARWGWVQYNQGADQGQLGETCLAGQGSWSGSAVVTANQEVVVIVNETKSGMGGMSYNGSD